MRYYLPVLAPHPYTPHEAIVTQIVPALRTAIETNGVTEDDWSLLMAVDGCLFEICDDFQVAETADDYTAIGAAALYALGSLHSTRGRPEWRIRKALGASVHFSKSALPPFVILHEPIKSPSPCISDAMAIHSAGRTPALHSEGSAYG